MIIQGLENLGGAAMWSYGHMSHAGVYIRDAAIAAPERIQYAAAASFFHMSNGAEYAMNAAIAAPGRIQYAAAASFVHMSNGAGYAMNAAIAAPGAIISAVTAAALFILTIPQKLTGAHDRVISFTAEKTGLEIHRKPPLMGGIPDPRPAEYFTKNKYVVKNMVINIELGTIAGIAAMVAAKIFIDIAFIPLIAGVCSLIVCVGVYKAASLYKQTVSEETNDLLVTYQANMNAIIGGEGIEIIEIPNFNTLMEFKKYPHLKDDLDAIHEMHNQLIIPALSQLVKQSKAQGIIEQINTLLTKYRRNPIIIQ